ncbi:unnamed protein product [Blepharisma stoltei]|uniref:Uncharacterized protein n=1 Tax=Blepharisma stoltei TaxID=1481888 RepID=A0AAU9JNY0_9CILI|nr:unnamed protein product [Blepharisma stoltei]
MNQDFQSQENYNKGRWNSEEKKKFEEALNLYGKDWNKIQNHIATRTLVQVRSHAQKYFRTVERPHEPKMPQLFRLKDSENIFEEYAAQMEQFKQIWELNNQVLYQTVPDQFYGFYPNVILPQKSEELRSCNMGPCKKLKLDYCE